VGDFLQASLFGTNGMDVLNYGEGFHIRFDCQPIRSAAQPLSTGAPALAPTKSRGASSHSNEWHFGYKAHIGVDKDSGLIHTLKVTAANVHDVTMTSKL
ncbi:transposase, partial [Intestinimonas massiliensis]